MDLPFMTLSEETICLPSEATTDPFVCVKRTGTLQLIETKAFKKKNQLLNRLVKY